VSADHVEVRDLSMALFNQYPTTPYDSALSTGQFSQGLNSLEGKWFADSYSNALLHGNALEGFGNFQILEADLPDNAPSLFKVPNLDGRGPATYIHLDDLQGVTPRPYSGGKYLR